MTSLVVSGYLDVSMLSVSNQTKVYSSNGITLQTINANSVLVPNGGIQVNNNSTINNTIQLGGSLTTVHNLHIHSDGFIKNEINTDSFTIEHINPDTINYIENSFSKRYGNNKSFIDLSDTWFGYDAFNIYTTNDAITFERNDGFGSYALSSIKNGNGNSAIGSYALQLTGDGNDNTSIGSHTIQNGGVSNQNTSIGYYSMNVLSDIDASMNVAIGNNSMKDAVVSYHNTCAGVSSCGHYDPVAGNTMTAIGYNSGNKDFQGTNTTYLGFNSDSSPYEGGNFFLNSTVIGYDASCNAMNQIMLGTSKETVEIPGTLHVHGNVDISGVLTYVSAVPSNLMSDIRLKRDIEPMKPILEKVIKINPTEFSWKKTEKRDVGYIAQEFFETMTEEVWPQDNRRTTNDGYMTLDYSKMVIYLTKAIQELTREYEMLQKELDDYTCSL